MVDENSPIVFGAPTLDRPFGLSLWPIFARAYTYLNGGSPPSTFDFQPGRTPMASAKETFGTLLMYYVVVLGGRELMRERAPMKLNGIFKIHNFYLTVISGGLLVLFVEQLIPTVVRGGIFHAICDYDGGWTPQLVVLYYVSLTTSATCGVLCDSGTSADFLLRS